MLKITLTYHPPDFDKWESEAPCPICKLKTPIAFGQIRREEYFICRGCHATIKAVDQMGGVQRLKYTIDNFFR